MGLSSLPSPSDGVLTLILVKTALSFSVFKEIFQSILHSIGLNHIYLFNSDFPDQFEPTFVSSADSISHRFKAQVKSIQFGQCADDGSGNGLGNHLDCIVCLSKFEPDSMVNRLPCGHLFHASCLEKWLDYHHVTCPICRSRLISNVSDLDEATYCPLS